MATQTPTADPMRTTARHSRMVAQPAYRTWAEHGSPAAALYFGADARSNPVYGTEVTIKKDGRHLVITGDAEGEIRVGAAKRLLLAAIPERFARPCVGEHEPATRVAVYPNGDREDVCDRHAVQAQHMHPGTTTEVIPEALPPREVELTRRPLPSDPARVSAWDVDRHESPCVVVTYSRYISRTARFGVAYIGPRGITRHTQGGPIEPGPHAYLIPLASVIAAGGRGTGYDIERGRAAGTEFDAPTGSHLLVDGRLFRIVDDRRMDYPRLVEVDAPQYFPSGPVTVADVKRHPEHYLTRDGRGHALAERSFCEHGYRLTDSCPRCD